MLLEPVFYACLKPWHVGGRFFYGARLALPLVLCHTYRASVFVIVVQAAESRERRRRALFGDYRSILPAESSLGVLVFTQQT